MNLYIIKCYSGICQESMDGTWYLNNFYEVCSLTNLGKITSLCGRISNIHRYDKPAVTYYGGSKIWYKNGKRINDK